MPAASAAPAPVMNGVAVAPPALVIAQPIQQVGPGNHVPMGGSLTQSTVALGVPVAGVSPCGHSPQMVMGSLNNNPSMTPASTPYQVTSSRGRFLHVLDHTVHRIDHLPPQKVRLRRRAAQRGRRRS